MCWGGWLSPKSSTMVDMWTLFLELTMNRVTGVIEAVIPWWQEVWKRETQLTQSSKCFIYVFKYSLSGGFMKNTSVLNIWLLHLYKIPLLFFSNIQILNLCWQNPYFTCETSTLMVSVHAETNTTFIQVDILFRQIIKAQNSLAHHDSFIIGMMTQVSQCGPLPGFSQNHGKDRGFIFCLTWG